MIEEKNIQELDSPNHKSDKESPRLVIVTGMSGGGKTQACRYLEDLGYFCVDKGSVTINGVSLTACEPDIQGDKGYMSVCIIPYTEENTNFKYIEAGTVVNLEFDILGKYMARYLSQMSQMNK